MINLTILSTLTPNGEFHLIINQDEVTLASGFGRDDDLKKRLPINNGGYVFKKIKNHRYIQAVSDYYFGDFTAINKILYHQEGSQFQKDVYENISNIPVGFTASYLSVAKDSGNSLAVRAVGACCRLNKLILLVPCHRVIRSDGSIGNYLYGSGIKRSLLEHEKLTTNTDYR